MLVGWTREVLTRRIPWREAFEDVEVTYGQFQIAAMSASQWGNVG